MKFRVFLDSNVFIYGFEFSSSNSAKILALLRNEEIEAVVSKRVLNEVTEYFRKYYSQQTAKNFRKFILISCTVILNQEVKEETRSFKNLIKGKDLEQLATVRKLGIKYLVSFDKDFKKIPEYITPKNFVKLLNYKSTKEEY